jgi:L-ascorbate metabolism protein UlaG (beta-lactamase superfamily)
MSPTDAAYATREMIKPKFAIPIHYGTTSQLKGTPAEYVSALGQSSTRVLAINPGDKLEF